MERLFPHSTFDLCSFELCVHVNCNLSCTLASSCDSMNKKGFIAYHASHIPRITFLISTNAPNTRYVSSSRHIKHDVHAQIGGTDSSDDAPIRRRSSDGGGGGNRPYSAKPASPPQQQRPRPAFDMLVVVEGVNDMKAVRRAVDADVRPFVLSSPCRVIKTSVSLHYHSKLQVYVLGTATRSGDDAVISKLNALATRYRGIVLLLDPDVAGRQARNQLNVSISECWHAFIPVPSARAAVAVRKKAAGNIGVEHAGPGAIRQALARKRKSIPGREEFTRLGLQESGLIAVMHERVRLFFEDFLTTIFIHSHALFHSRREVM